MADDQSITHKTCKVCGDTKPVGEFRRQSRECLVCRKHYERGWYANRIAHDTRTEKTCSLCQETKPITAFRATYRFCLICMNARERAKRVTHPEETKAKGRAKYAKNPEAHRRRNKRYCRKHPERVSAIHKRSYDKYPVGQRRARSKRWREAHPYKIREYRHRREAMLSNAEINDATDAQEQTVIATAKGRCPYCKVYNPTCKACRKGTHKLTIDHITAVGNHGNNTLHNLIACCLSCNSKKKKKPAPLFVQPLLL